MTRRTLRRDQRGATTVEFALIFMTLMTMLAGALEAGNIAFVRSIVEGSLRVASRMATTGQYSSADIDAYVRGQIGMVGIPAAAIVITRKSYASFDSVSHPEPVVSDVAPLGGAPGRGDCYLDLNGNGQWDSDSGNAGDGRSEDILYYGVQVSYAMLFAFLGATFGGANGHVTLNANTVVKNEPYGPDRDPPVQKCIP